MTIAYVLANPNVGFYAPEPLPHTPDDERLTQKLIAHPDLWIVGLSVHGQHYRIVEIAKSDGIFSDDFTDDAVCDEANKIKFMLYSRNFLRAKLPDDVVMIRPNELVCIPEIKKPDTPEIHSLAANRHKSVIIQEFLEWAQGNGLQLVDANRGDLNLRLRSEIIARSVGSSGRIFDDILYKFLGIDPVKLEEERQSLLDHMANTHE